VDLVHRVADGGGVGLHQVQPCELVSAVSYPSFHPQDGEADSDCGTWKTQECTKRQPGSIGFLLKEELHEGFRRQAGVAKDGADEGGVEVDVSLKGPHDVQWNRLLAVVRQELDNIFYHAKKELCDDIAGYGTQGTRRQAINFSP
jgi:hypothetical protein